MRRALLCGYYGMGNGGDEALLAALLQMLPSQIQPLVLSANPKATEKLHQVEAIDRWSVGALFKALKSSDVFIWGGGSLMQDATSIRNPVYYGGLMGLAQGMNLKTVAWAQGIGPLRTNLTYWITRRSFSHCDRISVRDQGSAKLLSDWQIPCIMAPDPVWALKAEPVIDLSSIPKPRIAVMLRSHPELTTQKLNCIIQALQFLQAATNAYLLLIPFQPTKDQAIATQIHTSLPKVSQVVIQSNPRILKGIFQGVDLAIAMRYHGLIMAAAEGCRCVAISYDPKVSHLMSDFNIFGWELQNLPTDPQVLSKILVEQFTTSRPFNTEQITMLVDQALIHQQVLADL